MFKIPWVNFKTCDWEHVTSLLNRSFVINQLTNYGPVVRDLELYFIETLKLSQDKAVIVVTNAALGMNALVAGINWTLGKKLKYTTQAFTFPCVAQGELQNTFIVDIDEEYGPDLAQVPDETDGLIVTNLFGHVGNIDKYLAWAQENHKILLFDNATVPFTMYKGRYAVDYGVGSIISLHHTKPIGFGEGGVIIVDKKYEANVRKCINFGFEVNDGVISWHPYGMNAKMSEIAAASILSHLQKKKDQIVEHQVKMYKLFSEKLKEVPGVRLFPNFGEVPFVSCFALICNFPITTAEIYECELNNITAKKYYTPLVDVPESTYLFSRMLCLPCHLDINEDSLNRYIEILKKLTVSK